MVQEAEHKITVDYLAIKALSIRFCFSKLFSVLIKVAFRKSKLWSDSLW